ncbi:MAG: cysE 1 [Bradyrhizobium sp.]|nr:cysE 1 [Bradyrhizobium sp.]
MSDGLWCQIKDDWRSNGRDWTKPGFRTLAVHRFGVWRMTVQPKLLRAPLSLLYRAAFRHCRNVYGIELPWSVKVGRGVVIEHQGGIVVHGASVIGDRCILRQNCTLGVRRLDDLSAAPVLENDVQLGAGAVLLGAIRIGHGATIGANAVVLHDVFAGGLATGVPARVTAQRASEQS